MYLLECEILYADQISKVIVNTSHYAFPPSPLTKTSLEFSQLRDPVALSLKLS